MLVMPAFHLGTSWCSDCTISNPAFLLLAWEEQQEVAQRTWIPVTHTGEPAEAPGSTLAGVAI